MREERRMHDWQQTDIIACLLAHTKNVGVFNPCIDHKKPVNDMNSETCPQLYYRG